jgi:hypothetical protein
MQRPVVATMPLHSTAPAMAAMTTDPLGCITGSRGPDASGRHLSRIAVNRGSTRLEQDIAVSVGYGTHEAGAVRWPVHWRPIGHTKVLPAFAGELVLRFVEEGGAVLRLSGTYRPPLGVVGVIVDATIGHRIAEASVEDFLRVVARRIEAEAQRRACGDTVGPVDPMSELWWG